MPSRGQAIRLGVLCLVVFLGSMAWLPDAGGAEGALPAARYASLIDSLRSAEKGVQNAAAREALRRARRALDLAEEHAEAGRVSDAERETATARAALAGMAIDQEEAGVQAMIREVADAIGSPAPAIEQVKPSIQTGGGLHVITFDTLQGTVTVNLPDDMAAGDTISGTVTTDPKGDSPEQKAKSEDSLSGVVVEVADQERPASGGKAKWIVPAAAAVAIPLILRDRNGREIGKVNVPVAKMPPPSQQKRSAGFAMPAMGQAGKPVEITGSFDGDFGTSGVRVGGQSINVMAESPRKLIVQSPTEVVGATQLEVSESGSVARCEFRNIAVALAAPTVNLKSGQTTIMTITVTGLQGKDEPFPLSVVNHSPTIVRVAQGNVQKIVVEPSRASAGTFVVNRTLTGVTPGGFNISAAIDPGSADTSRCSTPVANPVPSTPGTDIPSAAIINPTKVPRDEDPADDPEELRTSSIALHTGVRWRMLAGGVRIRTFRDNPPMTGVLDLAPGNVYSASLVTDTRTPYWRTRARSSLWFNSDHYLDGSAGRTFRDGENIDGLLGIAPAGEPARESAPAMRVRFHTNGLQLNPSVPVDLRLRKRGRDAVWRDVPDAYGSVVLDPSTIIVGIAVAVIREPGVTVPIIDEPFARLWFDGRSVGRVHSEVARGSHAATMVLDRDPHTGWTVDRLDEPGTGRLLANAAQDPDLVWSTCGSRFGKNIQFRLVRFGVVDAGAVRSQCATVASTAAAATESCISAWAEQLRTQTRNTQQAITIAMVSRYPGLGVAQAWRTGIVAAQEILSGPQYGANTLAHEIGHVLGFGNYMFNDEVMPAPNLMSRSAPGVLTRQQCDVAYETARSYAVSGPVR